MGSPVPDFRALFESAPGLYLVLTPDLRIVAVSDAYLRATMTTREQILGRGIFDVFPDNPDDPAATGVRNLRASLDRVLETKRADAMAVQKYDIRRPESEGGGFEERYWSPVNSPVVQDDRLVYIMHRVEDVTEFIYLKQVGREREQTTEALRIRAEQMESEIFLRAQELSNANRQLREANAEQARIYYQIAMLMEQADDELRVRSGGSELDDVIRNPISTDEMLARIGGLIAGHQRLEEQLRQSQKMEAVGRLAGGVAHDFNNLLTVISGYASLLIEKIAPGQMREDIEKIESAAYRAATLTRQLLAFSRQQVLQPRVLDLNTVVSSMEDLLRRLIGENIALVTMLAGGLGKVRADRSQIEQVIMNLTVNARDAMPSGGRLLIESKNVQIESDTESPFLTPGAYVTLMVSDTGHGMDAGTAAHIFEPFFTTKEMGKGTGLGLSTVYGIVEQSSGKLTVDSKPGEGAVFKVFLPVVADPEIDEEVPQPAIRSYPRTATVLLVEDEAPVRDYVRTVLTGAGYRIIEAANGEEATRASAKHQDRIDLVLTDVVMPGMSGPDLMDRLRETRDDLMVLYMSGYDRDLLDKRALDHSVNFLPKPFTPKTLLAAVAEVLVARKQLSPIGRRRSAMSR
ncbi:MAG: response regulator [Bryobacteraceae bacterium]